MSRNSDVSASLNAQIRGGTVKLKKVVIDQKKDEDIDWNVTWEFEGGHVNQSQLAQRLTVFTAAAGRDFRIRSFGFHIPSEGVSPPIPLQLADIISYSCLQPNDSHGAMKVLLSESRIPLHCYALHITPDLARKVWHPVAEMEALQRKRAKLANSGLKIGSKLKGIESQDCKTEQLNEVKKHVARLNRIAELLEMKERVSIEITET